MPSVTAPIARGSRPQDLATPAWGSSLLRGIQRLVLFDSPSPQDLINGTQLGRTGSALTRAATTMGQGMANTAESSFWTLPTFSTDVTTSYSVLWVGLHSGGTTPITIRDNSTSAGNILFWRNAGQWDMRVGGVDYAAAGTFATNRAYAALVTSSSTAAKTFVDGVLVINGGAPGSSSIPGPWYINQNGPNAQGPLATTLLVAVWNRPLSDREATELTLDPWKLFSDPILLMAKPAAVAGSHDASGSLAASAAEISGAAQHFALHTSEGSLSAQSATVSGTAARSAAHSATGSLQASDASIAGSALRASAGTHPSSGALVAQEAQVSGAATVVGSGPTEPTRSAGFEMVAHTPNRRLWWARKPKALDEEEAEEALEEAAETIVETVAKEVAKKSEPAKVKRAVKEAVKPVAEKMPGFDWQAFYRQAYEAAQQAREADARTQAAIREHIVRSLVAKERQRIEQDDEDIEILAMML